MMNRFLFRFGVLVGVTLGLWMCSKEPDVAPHKSQEPLYSVAKARAYYDGASCTTRTIAEPGPLTPGDYSLDWERAEVSLDSLLSSVDVPIDMQYRYYRYLQPEPDSVELVPIYSKLVVVKEHPTLLEGCYIRYVMPARSMRSAYPDYDYDALLNSRPKTDFTGVSLYTDLNGWPMCMAYYYEGELLFDAFLFDKAHTLEENIERLYNLIDDLTVARCSQVTTRAQQESPDLENQGILIDEVICIGKRPQKEEPNPEIEFDNEGDMPNPINYENASDLADGGGGTSSNSNSENNSSEHNENIKFEDEETKEIIEPLLDSIGQDCMGKTLLDALEGVTIEIGANHNGYNSATNTIELSPHSVYGYRDYVLLEELIHRYQYQQGYTTQCIEKEVEAKVGWALFLSNRHERNLQQGIRDAKSEIYSLNNSTHRGTSHLADALIFGIQIGSNDYHDFYDFAIYQLRTNPTYNEQKYPFLNNQDLINLQNINNIIIDCN